MIKKILLQVLMMTTLACSRPVMPPPLSPAKSPTVENNTSTSSKPSKESVSH